MATRSISIELEAKVSGFMSGLRTAGKAAEDMGSKLAKFSKDNEQHMDRVGRAGMVMGAGLLAGVALAVKAASEFDSAMSEVQASTHETAGNMDRLREAAINAGADTSFSAKEAAQGIDELAKAGVSTKDVLAGGLKGALSLAAAGSLAVGEAAEISATALTQFKLQGKDIPHVADLLAAGAGKAQGSVEDIGGALKQSGLVASQFGLSLEDTTGTLAAFASAGLVGSDSGTALKTMLLKLAAPAGESADKMAELGIAAYDSKGAFVGVTSLAGQLQDKLGGLTQAQRDSALATIFGTDAIRGANVLYEQGAKGIGDWIDKVNESGYAAVTASIKQDNLAGDIEKLGGSFDSLLIKSGSGVSESLRGLVQGAEDLVDGLGKIPTPALNAGLGIAGITGAGLLLGGAFMTILPKVADFKDSLDQIAPKGSKAASVIGGVGKAAGVAAGALVALQVAGAVFGEHDTKSAEDFGQALLKVANSGKDIDPSGLDSVFQGWNKLFSADVVTNVNGMSDAVRELTNQDFNDWMNLNLADPLNQLVNMPKTHIGQVTDEFKRLGDEMGNLTKNGGADTAAQSFKLLTSEFEKNGKSAQDALNAVPGYKDALQGLANEAGVVVEGQDLLDFAMGKVPASMGAATSAVQSYTDATGQVVPITPEVQEALDEIGVSAQGAATDLEKFTAALFAAGLSNLSAREAEAAHEAAIDATAGAIEEATAAIAKQYEAQGYGAEAAKAMAKEQMGLGAALNKSKTDFDRTTDAGRILNAQFQSVAQTGMAEIEAKAKAGAGMPELQQNLVDTFNAMKKTGEGMGLTGAAADALARDVMDIPPKANINTWMSDAAKRMAQETGAAVDAVNGKTANIYITTHRAEIITSTRSDSVQNNGGGKTKGPQAFAVGGAVAGPGTDTSDSILALLSDGEHVLDADDVRKMGGQAEVYRFRRMLDAGILPKFAAGGAVSAAAKRRLAELKKSAAYRAEQAAELRLDDARGESYRTVAGGLSSAYSFSDRLRTVANSGNLPSQRGTLLQRANWSDQMLRGLYARSERLGKSLETAKQRMEDLTQVRDTVAGTLSGEFSIGGAMKATSPFSEVTVGGIRGAGQAALGRIRAFAGKLQRLQQMGYSGAILQEIAGLGTAEGGAAADALLKGSKADVRDLNGVYTAIDSASNAAGTYVTNAMYKGGVNAAAGLVKGLQSQEKAIEQQMLKIGLSMEAALKKALGIRSPSRKAAAIGDNFTGTLAARLEAGKGSVAKQASALGDAMSVVPKVYTPATSYRPIPASAAQGPMAMTGTLVMDSGEILGVFNGVATQVARSEIRSADASSQYVRPGRR
ncbi:phage tail tape measure protein [Arthrobacter pascens]|uniref:phage tail tape measure protein n=1 Tax=Arthrobacter pascens TaxID=1677 RepID=UPI00196ADBAA|nr:phage tail tape measure protein [Arthrobacter pascens]MBN3498596.1 phage tail tape measure protein [Arthrobacter pascens]